MAGDKLHKYDLSLCEYALGNIRQYLRKKGFARAARDRLSPEMWQHLDQSDDLESEDVRLLLSDDEFNHLSTAFGGDVTELDDDWVAYDALHKRHVECVKEIRDNLTKQDAEEWSEQCARFAKRLSRKNLSLGEGIETVHDWVRCARRLLAAMGATDLLPCPKGHSPTPTNPTPKGSIASEAKRPESQKVRDIKTMRKAIARHERENPTIPESRRGRKAPLSALNKIARIRYQRASDALRDLEKLGEYSGFIRPRSQRYVDGRRNTR